MSEVQTFNLFRFVGMASEMRALQKHYFKTRDKEILVKSKQAEKGVDEWIQDIAKWNTQPSGGKPS